MGGSISPARCRPSWTSAGGLVAGRARERRDPTPGSRRLYEEPQTMSGEHRSLAEIARRVGITAPTLRRWVASGLVPVDGDGATTRGRRWPTRAWSRGCASAATRWPRSARRPRAAGWPPATSRACCPTRPRPGRWRDAARETGLEPALIERIFLVDGLRRPRPGAALRRRRAAAALRRRGAGRRAAARRLPAARARLRPGDVADRRRRGPALPPLRPRAADARRRPGLGDGRGDGGPRARDPAAGLADHGPRRTTGSCSTSSSRTSSATWRPTSATGGSTSAGCAWRSRSPTWPATRG